MSSRVGEIIQQVAIKVVRSLSSDADEAPLDCVETLTRVSEVNRCVVEWLVFCESSFFPMEQEDGSPGGVIVLDETETDIGKVRRFVHELAHCKLYRQRSRFADEFWELDDLGILERDAEERICRAVEDIVAALPQGVQWDGRIAIPRGGPVARYYRRLPTPPFMGYTEDHGDSAE